MSATDHAVANRYYRSGAIDFNCEFNIRQAEIQMSAGSKRGRKMWNSAVGTDKADVMSVCEGEPLFCVKRTKGNHFSSIDSCRNPIALLSSLNGYSCDGQSDLRDAAKKCGQSRHGAGGDKDEIECYDKLRDQFFKGLSPSGVAVSKWAYGKLGHQANQYVATRGGLNTLYVDDDVEAGETLVVDMPYIDNDDEIHSIRTAASGDADAKPWGLVRWQAKKGVPKGKRTLVIRALPQIPYGMSKAAGAAMKKARRGFFRRGQVIGKCVRGAKRGERADLTLEGNAIGIWSCHDAAHMC